MLVPAMKDEESEHKEVTAPQEGIEGKELPYLTAVSVCMCMW